MALVSMKPTSAGRRHMVKVVHPELHKGKPFAALTEKKNRIDGRDNYGHITTRHKGGGHKRAYRIVDFVRNKDGIPARVERLEYDPNRTAHIALVLFADGERRYIIAPKGLKAGDKLVNLPRIRQPIQLFLKGFRMVFDAAVNIDQFTVSIIEYLHLAGHRITAKEHPSGSAENLNITTNLIRKTV